MHYAQPFPLNGLWYDNVLHSMVTTNTALLLFILLVGKCEFASGLDPALPAPLSYRPLTEP